MINTIETLINRANDVYRERDIAEMYKSDPPPKYRRKGFVDYFGHVHGTPIAMEAKEYAKKAFPMSKIQDHQMEKLIGWQKHGAVSALAIHLSLYKRFWIVKITDDFLKQHWEPRKQLDLEALERVGKEVYITKVNGCDEYLDWMICFVDPLDPDNGLIDTDKYKRYAGMVNQIFNAFGVGKLVNPENQWLRQ